jgi:small-conductance mechanosensitive channel
MGTMERMSENEFHNLIQNYYFQLQKLESENQASKYLISNSFKFLMVTLGLLVIFISICPINSIRF